MYIKTHLINCIVYTNVCMYKYSYFQSILFGKKSTNQRRSQNSQRSTSRKPTLNSSSAPRGSVESELQSKASLLQVTKFYRISNIIAFWLIYFFNFSLFILLDCRKNKFSIGSVIVWSKFDPVVLWGLLCCRIRVVP